MQPSLPALGGSVLTEQPFAFGNQGADLTADLSNQPLDFTSSISRDRDPHMQSSYSAHLESLSLLFLPLLLVEEERLLLYLFESLVRLCLALSSSLSFARPLFRLSSLAIDL